MNVKSWMIAWLDGWMVGWMDGWMIKTEVGGQRSED